MVLSMAATEQADTATTRYVALLRGVNVSGHAKVPMAELRELIEGLGFLDVATYLNSGNAVFTAPTADESTLAAELERALLGHFGVPVSCLVRSGCYLRAVADANPYPEQARTGRLVHAVFLSERVGPERLAVLDPAGFAPDEYRLGEQVVYLHLPNGVGRSKLAEAVMRPSVLRGVTATARNWNTVRKLVELTGI